MGHIMWCLSYFSDSYFSLCVFVAYVSLFFRIGLFRLSCFCIGFCASGGGRFDAGIGSRVIFLYFFFSEGGRVFKVVLGLYFICVSCLFVRMIRDFASLLLVLG